MSTGHYWEHMEIANEPQSPHMVDERQYVIPILELLYNAGHDYGELYKQTLNTSNQVYKEKISLAINNALYVWCVSFYSLELNLEKVDFSMFNNPEVIRDIWTDTIESRSINLNANPDDVYNIFVALAQHIAFILSQIDDGHILDRIEWSENLGTSSIIVSAFCLKIY